MFDPGRLLLVALCFTAIFRICAFSRNLVNKSRWVHKFCSFWSWFYTCWCKEGSPISTGIISSAPWTKLKGDSLVADWGVHLSAHSTSNKSSSHWAFAPSNFFRNSTSMTLLAASAFLLVYGCSTELVMCFIPSPM